jgi:hypothetical protein
MKRVVFSSERERLYIVADGSIDLKVSSQGMSSTTICIQVCAFLIRWRECEVFAKERFGLNIACNAYKITSLLNNFVSLSTLNYAIATFPP